MPFNPIPKKEYNFKKLNFMSLSPGKHLVRNLTEDPLVWDVHNIQKTYVRCLGPDCPICKANKDIIFRSPEHFRDDPAYCGKTQRMVIQVLDLTPVKICSKADCKHPVEKVGRGYPDVCPKCGQFIKATPVTPLNMVAVLNMGKRLYDQLVALDGIKDEETQERIGLTGFNITLTVNGTGTDRTIIAEETEPLDRTVYEVKPEDLFEIEKAIIQLPAQKMVDLKNGAKLGDIFNSMRTSAPKPDDAKPDSEEDESDEVSKELERLFKPEE